MKYGFGIDVGGTFIKLGLFREDGTLLEKWSIPTVVTDEPASILQDICDTVLQKLHEKKISTGQVLGLGLGVPGPVAPDGTVNQCVNLRWGVLPVGQLLTDMTGFTVRVGNDANVAALGEQWKGGGQGYESIVMITLGTGVGGGVVLNGKIVGGIHGAAGEIGHMPAREDEPEQCGCGKYGCLEQYVSANGVSRLARRYLQAYPEVKTVLQPDADSLAVFTAAKAGDMAAAAITREMFALLGKALAQVACVIDPQAFVIGGGVSNAGKYLIDGIREAYQRCAFHASRDTEILLAQLGNDAGIYGAAKMILG